MATHHGISLRDVSAQDFIAAYAAHLKNSNKFELPKWVDIVKTAAFKELAPYDPDWLYIRAAAVARQVYLRSGVGMAHLRRHFGGKKRMGGKPERHADAASGIIRYVLQQLQGMKIVEAHPLGGRRITRAGQQELDAIAVQISRSKQTNAEVSIANAAVTTK